MANFNQIFKLASSDVKQYEIKTLYLRKSDLQKYTPLPIYFESTDVNSQQLTVNSQQLTVNI